MTTPDMSGVKFQVKPEITPDAAEQNGGLSGVTVGSYRNMNWSQSKQA